MTISDAIFDSKDIGNSFFGLLNIGPNHEITQRILMVLKGKMERNMEDNMNDDNQRVILVDDYTRNAVSLYVERLDGATDPTLSFIKSVKAAMVAYLHSADIVSKNMKMNEMIEEGAGSAEASNAGRNDE